MLNNLSQYQINALKQLTGFRGKFNDPGLSASLKKAKKDPVQKFIDIFCENNFADTDYSIIQQEILEADSIDVWIKQASLPAILKCLTYFIWTDKIMDGYFKTRIENKSVDKLLLRLEVLLKEENIAA
ncbi:MAG TPA: DUF6508 domain-containing protein [Chitinophagaceae bacterium]|nr:DUF6508 domain-containing protein [Chitinophagaceae bacterium]